VSVILEQLGLNQTLFIQFGIFALLFILLERLYFRPFLKLFEIRHERTVKDRKAAENLMAQAQAKLDEYKHLLAAERAKAHQEYESALVAARKEESEVLTKSWEEAKRLMQETAEQIQAQRETVKTQLEKDVDHLSKVIAERLLSRKVD